MDEEQQVSGALRVGIVWGVIGGIAGFAASLFLPFLGGLVAALMIGVACGRRSAVSGKEGASRNGFVSGALAAPVFALGAAAGTLAITQQVSLEDLASTAGERAGVAIDSQEVWQILIGATVVVGLMQAAALILTSVLFANRTARKRDESGEDGS